MGGSSVDDDPPLLRQDVAVPAYSEDDKCVAFSLVPGPRLGPAPPPTALLTAREIEVLRWLAHGKTSRDTAAILGISADTVNFHVKNATAKLGAANKTAAAVRAVVLGLLD